ncbi:MAG: PspC domain-containing protein [Gaiellales bacterium]
MTDRKRLYRSRDEKMIAGVLSGLGDYWNVDASIMRVGYAALTLLTGVVPGMVLYVLMVIIIPVEPEARAD